MQEQTVRVMSTLSSIPVLSGLSELGRSYRAYIIDLWGVVHDSVNPYPDAVVCLRQLRANGAKVVFLSNAPRPNDNVQAMLDRIGVPHDSYDMIVTSGDDTRDALATRRDGPHAALGRRYLHVGPEPNLCVVEGLDFDRVDDVGQADFLLTTGLYNEASETEEHYADLFVAALDYGLPMICANPDLTVMRGDRMVLCPGSLAADYEKRGGTVHYHGKPHAEVYDYCFERIGDFAKQDVLAIGDTPRTDLAGAARYGLETVLVTGGIHAEDFHPTPDAPADPTMIAAACAKENVRPIAAIDRLVW